MLEQEKTPKDSINRPSNGGGQGIKDKKLIAEVFPVKTSAKLEGHSLTLSAPDGSELTIDLLDCTVVAVSASNLPSRKWSVQILASSHASSVHLLWRASNNKQFFLLPSTKKHNSCFIPTVKFLTYDTIPRSAILYKQSE